MTKNKVLVVDDEESICELIKTYFDDDFDITIAYDGQTALTKFKQSQFDLVILDIMLPGLNGWDACRQIRQLGDTPIIMLSARGEDLDKILGLELGADDYVTKPFNPRELLARAKVILRRSKGSKEVTPQLIEYPGIVINNSAHQVIMLGQELELTPKEFELLWLFTSNPGMVFSREQLIQKVWGFDYLGDTRAIDSTIKRLRRKLESSPEAPCFIQTVWGVGYKFEVPT
jgi:two-component system response regulator ResD